ncbi:hypothetical protein [Polyangium aurulentum]|uniref:hypothetical protein n=1 Tax=Polyangium aurulentum TaxID=2567896 RepID=UPI0010AE63C3|nr:hypothetical protein [Polyangium aurulentum]UQA57436.1 hypothetical protein E8A73_040145 [Polyangium aurulentum]
MSLVRDAVARRNAQFDEMIEARLCSNDSELAAIEVVSEDGDQRDDDLRLVREALDGGASPNALGAVFVAVVTNFTYEVDWKDHFCFWPKMHEHLRSRTMNLHDPASRRAVERAFRSFSDEHRGVRPMGELLQHFPLMSWPLIHGVMPWCAQRHVARVLDCAAAEGLIPDDPAAPWPKGKIEALAVSMRVPVFVMGIIQNPTVLERLGRVLLGDAPRAEAPSWIRRLHRSVNRDALTRSLVAEAKESQRERASSRLARSPALPVSLLLQADGSKVDEVRMWASLGPYGRTVGSSPEVLSFARAGAALIARVDGADAGRVPLFNALAAPALTEVTWKADSLRLQPSARAYEGSEIPEVLKRAELDAERVFEPPLIFRREDDRRYALVIGRVCVGEKIAVLAVRASAIAYGVEAIGFAPKSVRGAPHLVALFGEASDAVESELGAAHISVEAPKPTLVPTLIPALRRDGERLICRAERDIWLRLCNGPVGGALSAEVVHNGQAQPAEIGDDDAGNILVHVPAGALGVGVHGIRILADGRPRAIASVEVIVEPTTQAAGLTRWRATLQPTEASIEHLRENQCWLEAESIPGVLVEVELKCGARVSSTTLEANDRGPLTTARRLRELATEVFASEDEVPEQVEIRARATDEPEGWLTIATLGASDAPLRFDLSGGTPALVAPDDVPSLLRLELGPDGLLYQPASPESLREPGLYLAKVGASRAALCVCDALRRVPRPPKVVRFMRSVERALELLATLRAVDVAALWPEMSRGSGIFVRRASARVIEREFVGSLCGRAWVEMEDAIERADLDTLARPMAGLLWVDEAWLRERIEDIEDPLDLLRDLLERIGERSDAFEARHLTLSFYQRGMITRGQDEAAVRWAWASVRRARVARACYLVDPNALAGAANGDDRE